MKSLLKITFRDMPSSKAIEDNIHEKANKLDSLYDDIMSCQAPAGRPGSTCRRIGKNIGREPRAEQACGARRCLRRYSGCLQCRGA